jgi:hypothetical protein
MFQAALFTTCQMPDRSGLPSAVRGIAWPADVAGMTTTIAAAMTAWTMLLVMDTSGFRV